MIYNNSCAVGLVGEELLPVVSPPRWLGVTGLCGAWKIDPFLAGSLLSAQQMAHFLLTSQTTLTKCPAFGEEEGKGHKEL